MIRTVRVLVEFAPASCRNHQLCPSTMSTIEIFIIIWFKKIELLIASASHVRLWSVKIVNHPYPWYWKGMFETRGEKLLDSLSRSGGNTSIIGNIDIGKTCNFQPLSHDENPKLKLAVKSYAMRPILLVLGQFPPGIHTLNWYIERFKSFCISLTANWPVGRPKFVVLARSHQSLYSETHDAKI